MSETRRRSFVFDIETDSLLDTCTKIHCLVIRDVDTDQVWSCADQPGYMSIAEGIDHLLTADWIIGHNILTFDGPALKKLRGVELPWEKLRDTAVIAGFRWTNIKELDGPLVRKGVLPPKLMGKHKLEAWGYRLGILKGDYGKDDEKKFAEWSKDLQDYCVQDTAVNAALVRHIRKAGGTPPQVIETEQRIRVYLDEQEQFGWPFNVEKAVALQAKLAARREELDGDLRKIFGCWYKNRGEFTPKGNNKKMGYVAGCTVTRVELIHFNPGSRHHIAERLQKLYGWKPTKFTPSGQPEIDEETLETLPPDIPGVKLLKEYLLVVKRLGQLAEGDKAWLKQITKDRPRGGKLTGLHHIHHVCLQSGTVTHRATHFGPNLGQVPKVGTPYGAECRDLFYVPEGWVQLGTDAASQQARELAHYMAKYDGGAYGKFVCEGKQSEGTDIHSVNRDALGLEGKKGRDDAKTLFYAYLFGAGDEKLGTDLGCTPEEVAAFKKQDEEWRRVKKILTNKAERIAQKENKKPIPPDDYRIACTMKGAQMRAKLQNNIVALGKLAEDLQKAVKKGYLVLHDGRRVPIRHKHAALNFLLQGGEAVVCKRWIARFDERLRAEFGQPGWDGLWVPLGWVHDEVQLAVRPQVVERVSQILLEEMEAVAREFNMRVPLKGEAQTGSSWAECH